MVFSRGLVISLGVSALSCTLLFLYFRNKISTIERKVDVVFDLVQNYQPTDNMNKYNEENFQYQQQNQDNTYSNDESDEKIQQNIILEDNRIQISDDESDDDSEEVSDSDESDDEEEIPKLSLAETNETEEIKLNDVKQITVDKVVEVNNNIEIEEIDSLDEIDDEDDDEEEDNNENQEDEEEDNNENQEDEEEINDDKNDDDDNELSSSQEDDINYNSLKVTELKAIAEAKGLNNYKSLKKGPLIELIKASE
jgi:hypothetical protein